MKKWRVLAAPVCAALLLSVPMAYGDDNAVAVAVTGTNVNLVAALCGDDAPASDVNALQVKEVTDGDGNVLEGYAGKVLHYIPTESAAALMKGEDHAGKTVTAKGVLYKNAQAIAITEFEVQVAAETGDDDWDDWDDWDEFGIKNHSQQQVI